MPGISKGMLTKELRENHEQRGLPQVEYSLTECGKSLRAVIMMMLDRGRNHFNL